MSSKGDIVERPLALSKVGCLKGPSSGEEEPSCAGLTYMKDCIKKALADLPRYEDIGSWMELLQSVQEFHFVNISMYLVESKDKM